FQAEDGIRDFHVTGVQTCALPILAIWAKVDDPIRLPPIFQHILHHLIDSLGAASRPLVRVPRTVPQKSEHQSVANSPEPVLVLAQPGNESARAGPEYRPVRLPPV